MTIYTIKPEYLPLWGEDATDDTIITEAELHRLADEWEKPMDDLKEQLIEHDFTPVSDAVIRQEGAPATAYIAVDAIRDDELPDEDGCVPLYELVWHDGNGEIARLIEAFDFDPSNPDDIRPTGYGWHIESRRRV